QFDFQPRRKRGGTLIGMPMDRGTAEAKDTKAVHRFCSGKFLRGEKRLAGVSGAIYGPVTFEQWKVTIKTGKRIGGTRVPADIANAQRAFEDEQWQQAEKDRADAKEDSFRHFR